MSAASNDEDSYIATIYPLRRIKTGRNTGGRIRYFVQLSTRVLICLYCSLVHPPTNDVSPTALEPPACRYSCGEGSLREIGPPYFARFPGWSLPSLSLFSLKMRIHSCSVPVNMQQNRHSVWAFVTDVVRWRLAKFFPLFSSSLRGTKNPKMPKGTAGVRACVPDT